LRPYRPIELTDMGISAVPNPPFCVIFLLMEITTKESIVSHFCGQTPQKGTFLFDGTNCRQSHVSPARLLTAFDHITDRATDVTKAASSRHTKVILVMS
jgi:hypothetical protein